MAAPAANCFAHACYRFKIAICAESEADPQFRSRNKSRSSFGGGIDAKPLVIDLFEVHGRIVASNVKIQDGSREPPD